MCAGAREPLVRWIEAHEYESLRQMQGTVKHECCADSHAFERAHYLQVLRAGRGLV